MAKNGFKIGVDIGASKVYAALIKNGKILSRYKVYFSAKGGSVSGGKNHKKDYILRSVLKAVEAASQGRKIYKIGLGVPCVVAGGMVKRCFNITVLEKIELKKMLEKRYAAKVSILNDTKAMLRYELWRNHELRKKRVLFIAWGTGIGGAFSINGEIQEGPHGFAGEIGHSIICAEAEKSLEDYAAGKAFQPKGKALWLQDLLKNKKSARVKRIFKEMGQGLGIGILNAIYHYDPDIVIIGGGLYSFLPYTLPYIRRALAENALIPEVSKIKIHRSSAVEDAGVLGAIF